MSFRKYLGKRVKPYGYISKILILFAVTFLALFVAVSFVLISVYNLFSNSEPTGSNFVISFIVSAVAYIFLLFYIGKKRDKYFFLKLSMPIMIWDRFRKQELYSLYDKSRGFKRGNIEYFPNIFYKIDGDIFRISIELDGSKFHEKFKDMGQMLSESFSYSLESHKIKNRHVIYEFNLKQDGRYSIDEKGHGSINKSPTVPITPAIDWNYDKAPHALITGQTGKGKSYLLFYMIRQLLSNSADVKIIDAKMSDLMILKGELGSENVVAEKNHIMRLLRETKESMIERYEYMNNHENFKVGQNYRSYGLKPLFLIFDELVAFASTLDNKEKKEMQGNLNEIILKGRQSGVFVIIATQRADAEYLGGAIRDNMALRVAIGSLSPDGYRMTFGQGYGDLIPREIGEGYVYIDGVHNMPKEFSAPYLDDNYDFLEDIKAIKNRLATA